MNDDLNREMVIVFEDGEPCRHPGCANHIIHECEGCGRIGAKGEVKIPRNVYNNWNLLSTWGPLHGNK